MTESEALLALQEADIQTMRINTQLARMPQQEKIQAIDKASRKLAGQLTAIIGQRKDLEMDLEDNERAHAEVLERTAAVKVEAATRAAGYRQTQDVEAHLTALAKRQEKLEFANLELTERLEKAEKAEANARALGERLVAERAAQLASFKQASSDLRARLRLLDDTRTRARGDISADVLARYDAAFKRFDGLAVESVNLTEEDIDVPSVCRVRLQSSLVAEVRRGGEIIECPYCHRILVIRRGVAA